MNHRKGRKRNPSVRKVFLALAVVLLLAVGCRPAAVPVGSEKATALEWMIVDGQMSHMQQDWNGRAVEAVFRTLDARPSITYSVYSEKQEKQVSRLLALNELPDILTVPAGGSLREKILGSGHVWNIQELSPALYDEIPSDIRQAYEDKEGKLFSLPGG